MAGALCTNCVDAVWEAATVTDTTEPMHFAALQRGPGPDVPLRRHPEFVITGTSLSQEVVTTPEGGQVASPQILRVLAAFATPQTLRTASAELARQLPTREAWIAAMDCIQACFREGILLPIDTVAPPTETRSFATESQHISMLNDTTRTESFLRAIRASVRPDDIVVDIGTGTGVLAIAAAQAGAAHVYAIERSSIAEVAQAGFEANGYADRITLIRGYSTHVSLPQPATLVVAEVIGDDLFDEHILAILADARRRLTTPHARFLPESLTPLLVPLRLPPENLAQWVYTEPTVSAWTGRYGIDFGWLAATPHRARAEFFERKLEAARQWQCADVIAMPTVTFGDHALFYSESVEWPGFEGANAIGLAFRSRLTDDVTLTTDPTAAQPPSSWAVPVWIPIGADLTTPGRVSVVSTRGSTRIRFVPTLDSAR